MNIEEIRALWGPNYYSRYPAIYMLLDIGELEERPSDTIPDMKDRLLKLIPTMMEHRCSPGYPGGFLERVGEGTWAGHIVEHVAIELQCLAHMDVGFGKTLGTDAKGVYKVVFRYRDPEVGVEAGKAAVMIVDALFNNKPIQIKPIITRLNEIRDENMFGPSTHSIIKEAQSRGIPHIRLNKHSYVQLGHGIHQRRIQATMVDNTSAIGVEIADDKEQTKEILLEAGVPVPRGKSTDSLDGAFIVAKDIGYPVTMKPLVGHHGKGITANVKNERELKIAYNSAKKFHDQVIVEKHLEGFDHRLLVINGELVAAARREPASVMGNGKSTIRELIDMVNKDPRRGIGHEKVLTKIKIDYMTKRLLKQQNLKLTDVLPEGRLLHLKSTANLSTGGCSIDVTDEVHPQIKRMAERISKIININVMGIDVVAPHLKRPLKETNGGVIEVNAAPGFRMHLEPYFGKKRNVAKPLVDMLFPPESESTIPIIAVTGTNGKTTTVRLISHILKYAGKSVGMCCTDGIEIGNQLVLEGDYSGPSGASHILTEPLVDHAVLEVARGGILRRGLGYDDSDVGVLLNISADHLGLDGINTLDELAELKSIVVETVKPEGVAILNADDERVMKCKDKIKSKIVLFSLNESNPALAVHTSNGGIVVTVKDGNLILRKGTLDMIIDRVSNIPITFGGKAAFNIANAMAAVAAAYSVGIDIKSIQTSLVTFNSSTGQLPGRVNLIDVGSFKVLIDYGHNPSAIESLAGLIPHLTNGKKINVGSGTGNRMDESLLDFGKNLGKMYDHIIICDSDPRQRKIGETAEMVRKGVLSTGFPKKNLQMVQDESEAIQTALRLAKDGDLVVIQANFIKKAIQIVLEYKENISIKGKNKKLA
ncbi:MAG: cyanophycin synthetase [Candidatus Thermoplasmatota archaeon]|nr:cyanophycin synthetase [Euryarchaeota archaeon]MBU4071864.1 cyanophycin synthetase [Candidatus Thermoplasmatota archaeon]MBU4144017.1 cyanophycin synthetase [Candidatus Thermoplasmatota archaeon]MBU4591869.1 cyanophycin synthetase [Candidatus Thermoplasmatota archaeon]